MTTSESCWKDELLGSENLTGNGRKIVLGFLLDENVPWSLMLSIVSLLHRCKHLSLSLVAVVASLKRPLYPLKLSI